MDEAGDKPTPAPRWASLTEDEQQKVGDTKDPAKARKLILNQLVRGESKGGRPYRYKRVDDVEGRWCEDGLPIGYYWSDALELDPLSGNAQVNWLNATAFWPERFGPRYRPALEIYAIEVVVWDGPPWVVEPAPADEPVILEPEPLPPKLELGSEPELSGPQPETLPSDSSRTSPNPLTKKGRLELILRGLKQEGELRVGMQAMAISSLARPRYYKRWPRIEGDRESEYPDRKVVREVFAKVMRENS